MYDVLMVGAGISAATLCACLKHRMRICVIDLRPQLAGNCHDRPDRDGYVHSYGPHIFHSKSQDVVRFLSRYTSWKQCTYNVEAEAEIDRDILRVPFPYSRRTEACIGRSLSESEILQAFFHGYSRKMWGIDWDDLPKSIRGRVPKNTRDTSEYFPGQFVGLPSNGYTRMIENMFDGVEIVLSASQRDWETVPAKRIIYTGRPDLIAVPCENGATFGEVFGLDLPHRSLSINIRSQSWSSPAASVHFCRPEVPHSRMTGYARLTGGTSMMVSTETPHAAARDDPTPYYPIPLAENIERHRQLAQHVRRAYPNLMLAGRLGSYMYLDMYQAVGQAMALAKRLSNADDSTASVTR